MAPIGIAGGLNLYGFAGGDPVNFSDPFGLCPTCPFAFIGAAVFGGIRAGSNILNGRPVLENVGRDALIGGAIGLSAGLAAPAVVGVLGSSAATVGGAEAIASGVANATGGAVSRLARSEGFKVTISTGGRSIVARIKEGGDFCAAIEGLGALTRRGQLSSDRSLTHLTGATIEDVTNLVQSAGELLRTLQR